MTDSFSTIGLGDTSLTIDCKMYAFFSALADAPEDINGLLAELQWLNAMLDEFRMYTTAYHQPPFSFNDDYKRSLVFATLEIS